MTARKAVPSMVVCLVLDPPYSALISPYRVFRKVWESRRTAAWKAVPPWVVRLVLDPPYSAPISP